MKVTDFKRGDRVRYVPYHVHGDKEHEDCEDGIVSSHNDRVVYVKYYRTMPDGTRWPPIETGAEPYSAAATLPSELIHMEDK